MALKGTPYPLGSHSKVFPPTLFLVSTDLLSVSMDLPTLNISYK